MVSFLLPYWPALTQHLQKPLRNKRRRYEGNVIRPESRSSDQPVTENPVHVLDLRIKFDTTLQLSQMYRELYHSSQQPAGAPLVRRLWAACHAIELRDGEGS